MLEPCPMAHRRLVRGIRGIPPERRREYLHIYLQCLPNVDLLLRRVASKPRISALDKSLPDEPDSQTLFLVLTV